MKPSVKPLYSPARIARQVARMGREISRTYAGQRVDVVITLEDAYMFSADLLRQIKSPVVCHFIRAQTHTVRIAGFERKEIFFGGEPDLAERNVLLVEAVLDTGITLDFLAERILETGPRSLKLAVLLDRPDTRRVALKPDFRGFQAASNYLVGYGLCDQNGLYRNLPYVGVLNGSPRAARSVAGRAKSKKGKRVGK